jgi:hypothetical protein
MKNTIWGVYCDDAAMRHLSDSRASVDPGWRDYTQLMKAMFRQSGLIGDLDGPFDASALGAAMESHNQVVRDISAARARSGRMIPSRMGNDHGAG